MSEDSLMTPEIQAMVGQETDLPGSVIIDQSCIERYIEAVGDLNPLYLDEDYARKTGYVGIIAPGPFYLPPVDYYRGNPEALLAERNRKLKAEFDRRAQYGFIDTWVLVVLALIVEC